MSWLEAWAAIAAASLIIGAVWVWLERKCPPHSHDEGDHDPRCPGCFAEKVRRRGKQHWSAAEREKIRNLIKSGTQEDLVEAQRIIMQVFE